MVKLFGLPIIIAFVLGYYFPYTALSLSPYAFIILFLMMTFSALDMNWTVLKKIPENKVPLLSGLFFLFLYFPLMQWFLARALVSEVSLFYGTLLASISPVAIVAPGFTRMHKGDEDLSFLFMILSMVLFPPMVLLTLSITHQTMHMRPIVYDMAILIFVPLVLGKIIKIIDQKIFKKRITIFCKSIANEFNMLSIAFLAFIYLGASISKLNLTYTPWKESLGVLLVIFFQDFGVYFLGRFLMRKLFEKPKADALAIGLSMKNLAVAGGILLFYDPKASLAGALGFFVHALFFNFIALTKPKN